jgi:hypothetical protein
MRFTHVILRRPALLPVGILSVAVTLCVALALGVGQSSGQTLPTTTTTSTPSPTTVMSGTGYPGHPVGVPIGAVSAVSDCPTSPAWSAPLPQGVTVSPPFLGTSSSGSVTVTSDGNTVTTSNAGQCGYTLNVPGTPDPNVTYFGGSAYYAAVNSEFGFDADNGNSQECSTNAELGNFGSAFAKQELLSSNCNTDSTGIWGYAQITNGSYQSGSIVSEEPSLNQWYQSTVSGSAFYATFQICLQNPVGQQVNYDCIYDYFGPYY